MAYLPCIPFHPGCQEARLCTVGPSGASLPQEDVSGGTVSSVAPCPMPVAWTLSSVTPCCILPQLPFPSHAFFSSPCSA